DRKDKAELAALDRARIPLTEAVQKAERQIGGKAIDAGLEERNGTVAYEIAIVKDSTVQSVRIDLQSGEIAAR
ncbi:MAG: PepSY domain-containing protein, partial [Alphaproteobacteria bacterium]|nr:PepSY domain-containing protein [Alphaproteobacteria bacterium]